MQSHADSHQQDFIPKLKQHLLPRIKSLLSAENAGACPGTSPTIPDNDANEDWHAVLFKQDRIYKHNIMRINYTTYDVRRGEDMIHPGTSHCNIMVLNPGVSEHPFWYARVLGIYHVNVVYAGDGTVDYLPRRLEFLWVRWYQMDNVPVSWTNKCLDRVHFPPMMREDSFGFLDPSDILRGCHLMPAFSRGKVHPDGAGVSHCAQDSRDWKAYYVGRCVFIHHKSTASINSLC